MLIFHAEYRYLFPNNAAIPYSLCCRTNSSIVIYKVRIDVSIYWTYTDLESQWDRAMCPAIVQTDTCTYNSFFQGEVQAELLYSTAVLQYDKLGVAMLLIIRDCRVIKLYLCLVYVPPTHTLPNTFRRPCYDIHTYIRNYENKQIKRHLAARTDTCWVRTFQRCLVIYALLPVVTLIRP